MSRFDHSKYTQYMPIQKADRSWPNKVIEKAPHWCSVDLRDGNQALIEPMNPEQKLEMFKLLVDCGFKEIEVGFPSASQTDFDFVRKLIEDNYIPDDVTIQVLTQAREELISRSYESLVGAKRAIVHVYNSTSTIQRAQVFRKSKEEIKQIAINGAQWVKDYAAKYPETEWQFQYSPESFTGTEVEYAVEVCDAVINIWQPTPENPAIINLPATVEMNMPNVFADQVEWVCENIAKRDSVIISLHTHNDRGCAVAAAEMGLLAGADRIEGTLLGNGERTGNMDLVTCAMNMYSRGVDPELDLANIDRIIQVVESCTQLKVHPRHPYVGELVFAAFSGSHQDAINKCLAQYTPEEKWEVAYLPIDPRDVGRNYQEVIRINSQSGKGGVAYILASEHGFQLPRWMQIDFSPVVQQEAERSEGELTSETIAALFKDTYVTVENAPTIESFDVSFHDNVEHVSASIKHGDKQVDVKAEGTGPLDALVQGLNDAFGYNIAIVEYNEHTLGENESAEAIAYIQANIDGQRYCGASTSPDIIKASFQALLNTVANAK